MAKTPQSAEKLLTGIVPAATARARDEAARMQKVIDAEKGGFQLGPADWEFYAEKVRKADYDLDESQVKPYFELEHVLRDGVFFAATKLYGITFKERKDLPVYQADVRVFEVFDTNGKSLALFYADYFQRSNKDGGAWQGLKGVSDEARARVNQIAGAELGDALIFVADKYKVANTALGHIRLHLGDKLGLTRKGEWRFMWLTDPPLFEVDDATGEIAAAHHPFTSPRAEDEALLETAPERVLARAYDLVLNGVEVGGGSIRIHRSELQARAFKALRISEDDQRAKFGFLLDAFKYGPPPHGGIAFGLDRLAMLMASAESLRDVIAFPKTQKGSDLMTECPTPVSQKQLDELFVQVKPDLPR
jgi:aspartyl-tRNA synthetase